MSFSTFHDVRFLSFRSSFRISSNFLSSLKHVQTSWNRSKIESPFYSRLLSFCFELQDELRILCSTSKLFKRRQTVQRSRVHRAWQIFKLDFLEKQPLLFPSRLIFARRITSYTVHRTLCTRPKWCDDFQRVGAHGSIGIYNGPWSRDLQAGSAWRVIANLCRRWSERSAEKREIAARSPVCLIDSSAFQTGCDIGRLAFPKYQAANHVSRRILNQPVANMCIHFLCLRTFRGRPTVSREILIFPRTICRFLLIERSSEDVNCVYTRVPVRWNYVSSVGINKETTFFSDSKNPTISPETLELLLGWFTTTLTTLFVTFSRVTLWLWVSMRIRILSGVIFIGNRYLWIWSSIFTLSRFVNLGRLFLSKKTQLYEDQTVVRLLFVDF